MGIPQVCHLITRYKYKRRKNSAGTYDERANEVHTPGYISTDVQCAMRQGKAEYRYDSVNLIPESRKIRSKANAVNCSRRSKGLQRPWDSERLCRRGKPRVGKADSIGTRQMWG